jgi:hypothetical protein
MLMKAKMQVSQVTDFGGNNQQVKMAPVCGRQPFGLNGESEDNTFARYTPSGELTLTITNPDLLGKLKPGQVFYLEFTAAAE